MVPSATGPYYPVLLNALLNCYSLNWKALSVWPGDIVNSQLCEIFVILVFQWSEGVFYLQEVYPARYRALSPEFVSESQDLISGSFLTNMWLWWPISILLP